jgi:hypothetical protein
MYTTAAAWQDHAEQWEGCLEPDKVATSVSSVSAA